MKKRVVCFFVLLFSSMVIIPSTIAMDVNSLTYGDLLSLYFWALTPDWKNTNHPVLNYTNINENDSLYPLLEKAVANDKFPNLSIPLPLNNQAYEDDLALLIKNNFWKDIEYSKGKKLTFNFLLTELKAVYKKNAEKQESSQIINSILQNSPVTNDEIADSVLSLLKNNYINKDQLSSTSSIEYDNLSEFVESLGEEYTVYYNPKEGKDFMDNLNWEFAWIWVYIEQLGDENPKIVEVIPWTPAEDVGLQAEDQIMSIDWKVLSDFSDSSSFIDALKGEVWSRVQVWIKRDGQNLSKIITRAIIQVPTVVTTKKWWTCYVNVYSFDIGSKDSFLDKFKNLGSCDQYIFDVRSNPGWVIDEVTWILDKFIPYWKVIMTEKWVDENEVIKSIEIPSYSLNKTTYVLIDNYTASAAEIFAGVLKHYYPNTVKLVGTQTYGKGSVQQVVQFPNDAIIKYTIWLWYVADEETSIDKVWLTPDIYVADNPYTSQDEVLERIGFKLDS